ncbi:alkaline phosphatase family protein [Brachybacterium sp. DNPG3]
MAGIVDPVDPAGPGLPDGWPSDLLPPPFAGGARPELLDVLAPLAPAETVGRDVVVLLDGVGAELLAAHRALTPVLRRLADETRAVRTVFPSTTATAMVSLHTARPPVEHGVIGWVTHDPATGLALNQIQGDRAVDPLRWMPLTTPVEASGRRAFQVAPSKHQGSHLSRVAYRGWGFVGHGAHDRADATVIAVRRAGPDGLVHLHVDDVDHAGHVHGVDSEPWRAALAEADALLGTLLRRLPAGTRLHVTADHGMVDTDPAHTVDLADHPALQDLAVTVAGESRALALGTRGAEEAAALEAGLAELLGERALVLGREALLAAGLLGPPGRRPGAEISGRVPDVAVLARGRWIVDDFSRRPESARRLVGVHGSLTSAEALIPLLRTTV